MVGTHQASLINGISLLPAENTPPIGSQPGASRQVAIAGRAGNVSPWMVFLYHTLDKSEDFWGLHHAAV